MERMEGWFAAQESTVMGWECLTMGPFMSFLVFPLLLWLVNFGLLWMWLRALTGKPVPSKHAWAVAVIAVIGFLPMAIMPVKPLAGALVWLAAIVFGGYAASSGYEPRP
jgi:hypothetical protein